jgi:myo-inositol 2-dehydrogenase/D-chiro-inositol 1-dehydrogenase
MGVIGAGRIGKLHAGNLATRIRDAEVVAVADVNVKSAQALAEHLQVPILYDDYHAILCETSVDALALYSSTDTHPGIMVEAAQAGKHIFCEKPIAFELEKIDAALDAVEKAGVNRDLFESFGRMYLLRSLVSRGAFPL